MRRTLAVLALPVAIAALGATVRARPGGHGPRAGECLLASAPHVVAEEPSSLLQYWLVEDAPYLHEPAVPGSPSLRAFRQRIGATFDTLPLALLEGQLVHTSGGDRRNVRLVLDGEAGYVRQMSCLEALLLSTQTDRSARQGRSMYTHPTEFLSYVLERADTLKIWYYTVDQPGVRRLARLHEPLERDLEDRWGVVTVIHNHNFFPMAAAAGDALLGGVAPSVTDVQYLRSMRGPLRLTSATITNGFHSVELAIRELDRLAAR